MGIAPSSNHHGSNYSTLKEQATLLLGLGLMLKIFGLGLGHPLPMQQQQQTNQPLQEEEPPLTPPPSGSPTATAGKRKKKRAHRTFPLSPGASLLLWRLLYPQHPNYKHCAALI
eukprot:jgi/Psemu1/20628/gm1.20628_g